MSALVKSEAAWRRVSESAKRVASQLCDFVKLEKPLTGTLEIPPDVFRRIIFEQLLLERP
jgi:hypothetical protein